MSHIKLGVEVAGAHDLLSKEGGVSNPFVEIHFDGQKFRTTVKDKDLNPVWNENFYFNISDPTIISDLTLEAYLYHQSRSDPKKKVCLGKVCLTGTSFVTFSEAVLLHYPLDKPGVFSRARGELGLRVFMTSDPYIRSSNPLPSMESSMVDDFLHGQGSEQRVPGSGLFNRAEKRRTFRHLPNKGQQSTEQIPQQQMPMNYGMAQEMKSGPGMGPRVVYPGQMPQVYPGQMPQPMDYSIKETSPNLGGGRVVGGRVIPNNRPTSTYDLVEKVQYLFVRVVKARDLPTMDLTGALDPYVEVKMGNYKGKTKYYEKTKTPEWNEVFAFSNDQRQAHILEVIVKDKDVLVDEFVGRVFFDLHEIPTRVPPDSPLAPEWYRLEDKNGEKVKNGELMVAVWNGTQADEAFPDAIHTNAAVPDDMHYSYQTHIRSKVYQSPRLWYLRVNVLSAQDLVASEKTRFPDVYVRVQIGNQVHRTRTVQARNMNPIWNEEMMLVAAEPFDEHLVLTVEDRVGNKDDMLGKVLLPLSTVQKRVDEKDKGRRPQWYSMEKSTAAALDGDHLRKDKFFSKLQLMVSLEGGYHVLDESTHYSSDLRPTARQLWKPSIGVLEVGILSADGLQPMKTREGRGTSDTFCVAKYGHKWVRTRTVLNSLSPKYNEQYTWEVYDPATVLTLGVFDNGQIESSNGGTKDTKIGKVRVRISTLEAGRVYTHSYPLLVLHPSGVKKMGELHLAIRFSCTSMINLMTLYSKPLLPKMHYVRPLTVMQQENLRVHAVGIVASRMARTEPPLRREVVEYMSDVHSHLWSMRRSKAHFFRLTNVFSGLISITKWFGEVCEWKNPVTSILMHLLLALLVYFPELILPTGFLYMCLIGIWNYYYRPKYPPHMDTRISHADTVHPDELDEEFDTFPTSRSPDIVKMRYDRLRHVAGRIQSVVGDIASQGERVQSLLSWRDTRASAIFILFCFGAAIFLYVTPFQLLVLAGGYYVMRHPRFRRKMPSVPLNFFRRLPARTDSML